MKKVLNPEVNWEQTARDVEQIMCDSGDLLRECHAELLRLGGEQMAEKVKLFCDRVHHCMVTGQEWQDTEQ